MKDVVFVTGNSKKAEYLSNLIGCPVEHKSVDLDEIQSLDLRPIVDHKLKQAYAQINRPVLVEDVSLEFKALGKLPGPFIRFFLESMSLDDVCHLLDNKDRSAVIRTLFGYFDGSKTTYFEGVLDGTIALKPSGSGGFGFDPLFIPLGYSVTRAQMSPEDDQKTYLQAKPLLKIKEFLLNKAL